MPDQAPQKPSSTQIIGAISDTVRKASTRSLDVSFNELLDMVSAEELNITPDYQRLFRWSEGQRSRFIESLILEMPVPPVFVIEVDDGKYQLIDGLQRISSYLHLRGELEAPHLPTKPVQKGDKLRLSDCDIVKELNDFTYDELPTAIQIRLKRAFIRMEVVRKETDPHFKYHMFKRLNTGGEGLSDQQVRNCTIRMLGNDFPDFIVRLSNKPHFVNCVAALTEARVLSAVDQELVLRFFALKNWRPNFKHEVSDFLTEYMENVADPTKNFPFNYAEEERIFDKTFATLDATLSDKSFAFRNKAGTDLAAGFSIYHFEAVTIGLQDAIDKIDLTNSSQIDTLRDALKRAKLNADFVRLTTGGGKNSPGPLNDRISSISEAVQYALA